MGNKRPKVVNVAGKDFIFNPTCEFNPIFDQVIIKWLLAPERAGLFVVEDVEDKTPSKLQPEMTTIGQKQPEMPSAAPKTEKTGKDTPKRGRPKKKR
jgi:hypothetical protein